MRNDDEDRRYGRGASYFNGGRGDYDYGRPDEYYPERGRHGEQASAFGNPHGRQNPYPGGDYDYGYGYGYGGRDGDGFGEHGDRSENYGRARYGQDRRDGGAGRVGRDGWPDRDQPYGQGAGGRGNRLRPETGYSGDTAEYGGYGGYDRYSRGSRGGYGTGAGQGGQSGGYQLSGSYGSRDDLNRPGNRRYGSESGPGRGGRQQADWERGSYQGAGEGYQRYQGDQASSPQGRYGGRRTTPKGYTRSDERIREDVCERLSRSGLDVSDVSVEVAQGRVTLEGTVSDRHTKHAIEDCADDCMGVQDIDNRMRVRRELPWEGGPGGASAGPASAGQASGNK